MLSGTCLHYGILGGSFNPIHNGHLELGRQAMCQFSLDKILVMPNNHPGYKDLSGDISTKQRTQMIKLAIEDKPGLCFSDFELKRPGITYTSDTLEALHSLYPKIKWYFIMGGDSIMYFDKWHRPDIILQHATLLVTTRGDVSEQVICDRISYLKNLFPHANICLERISSHDISSSAIRNSIARGDSIHGLVPDNVERYILDNNLYR